MSRPAVLLLAALFAAAPVLAPAAAPPRQAPAVSPPAIAASRNAMAAFNLLDRGGKGSVTADEFLRGRPYAGRVFAALDLDGDGTIERREFLTGGGGGALRAAEFARLNRSHDGRLTQAEFARGWGPELFQALSRGRGVLTAGDLRPGLPVAAAPVSPRPVQPAAAEPRRPGQPHNLCWIPLTGGGDHWGVIFPWGPSCP